MEARRTPTLDRDGSAPGSPKGSEGPGLGGALGRAGRSPLARIGAQALFAADELDLRAEGGPAPGASEADAGLLPLFAGRVAELSGHTRGAPLTAAIALVREAQEAGEPAVWIAAGGSTLHPPDAAASGVDLAALPIVRAGEASRAASAARRLAASGAFGLIAVDLGLPGPRGRPPIGRDEPDSPALSTALARLAALARHHDLAVVLLTRKADEAESVDSLVGLRAAAEREAFRAPDESEDPAAPRTVCRLRALKDKRLGPGWTWTLEAAPPPGLVDANPIEAARGRTPDRAASDEAPPTEEAG